jgi:hypothetical protein
MSCPRILEIHRADVRVDVLAEVLLVDDQRRHQAVHGS